MFYDLYYVANPSLSHSSAASPRQAPLREETNSGLGLTLLLSQCGTRGKVTCFRGPIYPLSSPSSPFLCSLT